MNKLSEATKYYIAGFLDGDGCINAQIVKRDDYKLKFQIKVYVSFYQKTKHHWFLIWLQKNLEYGSIRKRNDGMSEYTITGPDPVQNLLKQLEPMVRIKKPQLKGVIDRGLLHKIKQ